MSELSTSSIAILPGTATTGPVGYATGKPYVVITVLPTTNPAAPPTYPVISTEKTTPCDDKVVPTYPVIPDTKSTPCDDKVVPTYPVIPDTKSTPCDDIPVTPTTPCEEDTPKHPEYKAIPEQPTTPCETPVVPTGYNAVPDVPSTPSTPCETPATPATPCDDSSVVATLPAAYGSIASGAQSTTVGALAVAFFALFL